MGSQRDYRNHSTQLSNIRRGGGFKMCTNSLILCPSNTAGLPSPLQCELYLVTRF